MKKKTERLKMADVALIGFRSNSATSCPSGAFDTAAALDAQAAIIRNRSWSTAPNQRTWDNGHTSAPDSDSDSDSDSESATASTLGDL
jgi:hypothetical protein